MKTSRVPMMRVVWLLVAVVLIFGVRNAWREAVWSRTDAAPPVATHIIYPPERPGFVLVSNPRGDGWQWIPVSDPGPPLYTYFDQVKR